MVTILLRSPFTMIKKEMAPNRGALTNNNRKISLTAGAEEVKYQIFFLVVVVKVVVVVVVSNIYIII